MPKVKFFYFPILFVVLCAFQCDQDIEDCVEIISLTSEFPIEQSAENSTFKIGDEIRFSSDFSSTIVDQGNNTTYSVLDQSLLFDFDIFEVLPSNLNVSNVDTKIDIDADFTSRVESESISKEIQVICDQNCSFEITLSLLEKGYYGIVFKSGIFSAIDDCIDVQIIASTSDTQNFDILQEIGTNTINYENPSLFIITETNSFFFKVED